MRPLSLSICGAHPGRVWLTASLCARVPGLSVQGVWAGDATDAVAASLGAGAHADGHRACADPASDGLVLLDGVEKLGVEAIEAGKHLLASPPLGAGAWRDLFRLAARRDRALMPHLPTLCAPQLNKAVELVGDRAVGRPSTVRLRSAIAASGGWDERLCPGAPRLAARPAPNVRRDLHASLALCRLLLGEVDELFSYGTVDGDAPRLVVTWKHRAHATYGALEWTVLPGTALRSCHEPREDSLELTGSSGLLWLHLGPGRMRVEPTLRVYQRQNLLSFQTLDDDPSAGHVNSLTRFAEAIRGKAPWPTAAETEQVAGYVEAVMESLERGQRVSVG